MQPSSLNAGNNADGEALQALANRINTLDYCDNDSRALVVFNLGNTVRGEMACLACEVTWQVQQLFPGVIITDQFGVPAQSFISDHSYRPDHRGRKGLVRMHFVLRFLVDQLDGSSWRTFIARIGSDDGAVASCVAGAPCLNLFVIETTRHNGDLDMSGTFGVDFR